MVITMNGKDAEVADGLSLQALLDDKAISADSVVVELNKEIVPAEAFGETRLNDGDHLEVLRFVGGG